MSDCNDKKRKSEEKPELKTSDSNNENVITKVKKAPLLPEATL